MSKIKTNFSSEQAHNELAHHCVDFKHSAKHHKTDHYPVEIRRYAELHEAKRESSLSTEEHHEKTLLKHKVVAYFNRTTA